jgi:hypothetical protein
VLYLGGILPSGVTVKRIDFKGSGQSVSVAAAVKGLDATASDEASRFVQQLQADEELKKHFGSVNLINLSRNAEEASLNLDLLLSFKKDASVGSPPKGAKK